MCSIAVNFCTISVSSNPATLRETKLQPLEEHLQFQRFYDTAESLSPPYGDGAESLGLMRIKDLPEFLPMKLKFRFVLPR